MSQLNEKDLYEILCATLPKQNDYAESDYTEELQELLYFGIETKEQLLELILKHKEELLAIDSAEMDGSEIKYFTDIFGEEYVKNRVENKFWYAYPGLLRLILEIEFEDDYRDFAQERDEDETDLN